MEYGRSGKNNRINICAKVRETEEGEEACTSKIFSAGSHARNSGGVLF